jgi:uncharacterized DUF497 family protein
MRYEWDPEKAAANLQKHGVAFDLIRGFDWVAAFTRPDDRRDYREARWVSIGEIEGRIQGGVYGARRRGASDFDAQGQRTGSEEVR